MTLGLAIGSFCFAFLLASGLNWLALIPWRRSTGKHWTERARLLYPAQKSARLNNWLIPANFGVFSYVAFQDADFPFAVFPAFWGCALAGYFLVHEAFPDLQFKSWLRLILAVLCLFLGWWVVLILTIFQMPDNFGAWTWALAGGVLMLFVAFHFGLGLLFLRWFNLLKPATEPVKALVAEVSQRMGVPVRAAWILKIHLSNAVALPLTRQLVFTEKMLSTLTDNEIKAVCAHELGHLNEPRKVLFVRILASSAFYPLIFSRPLGSLGDNGSNAVFALIVADLLVWLAGIRVARSMEKRADTIAQDCQTDKAVYARALEKLYETNQTPAVMPRRSNKIHPDLYDRMTAAGVVPSFQKPAPPKGQAWTSYLTLASLFVLPFAYGFIKALLTIGNAVGITIK